MNRPLFTEKYLREAHSSAACGDSSMSRYPMKMFSSLTCVLVLFAIGLMAAPAEGATIAKLQDLVRVEARNSTNLFLPNEMEGNQLPAFILW